MIELEIHEISDSNPLILNHFQLDNGEPVLRMWREP